MSQYNIVVQQDNEIFNFVCSAEDYNHALEQATNAYPNADIIG